MSPHFHDPGHAAQRRAPNEGPRAEARGPDAVRVRAAPHGAPLDGPPGAPLPEVAATRDETEAAL